ncbi:hypothetical protein BpHYR1_009909 [Brachionus plicatilis]|uniref:SH3 domain-containing protein n=1 Tax=Brachionus plicatilis TaxID=10195 RepID=A0A3M7RER9_BRAPC|nr:hypothetical protein BpHYR1_009909 [Brachionus plicatilis]
MFQYSPDFKPVAKEAKIVKLSRFPPEKSKPKFHHSSFNDSDFSDISFLSFSQIESSSEAHSTIINNSLNSSNSIKYSSDSENEVSTVYLEKLYIIKDHTTQLAYGGISVKRDELVYLISQSEYYYLIENQRGVQGIVPKDICVNLEETVRNARQNLKSKTKITSL